MTTSQPLSAELVSAVKEHIAGGFPSSVATLGELVRIPGIAWAAFDSENLVRSATRVAEHLRGTGVFDWVEIRQAPIPDTNPVKLGSPAVVAKRAAKNGAPQVLLYAHHDVQPPGDENIWQTPAFEPTVKNGRMFGRGAADDKAGIVAHLAAIGALRDIAGKDFDLGITVFFEGEEEAGSPSFRNFLEANQTDLKSDVIVVADSGNWSTKVPAITTTLRGLVSQVIEVRTLDHAVHSGMFGGVVPDALMPLARILASFHDESGGVAVKGLVEGRAAALDYSEEQLRTDSGVLDQVSLIGSGSILDRNWTKPAITVIGIDAPSVAVSSNTLVPTARAKVTMRIAPGQDPEEALNLLRSHISEHTPFGAQVIFEDVELGKPYLVNDTGWAKPLLQQALTQGFGFESVDIGIGGSIPFIADLVELFPAAQILVTGVEDPDSRAHSPDESVDLKSLQSAMTSEALLLLGSNLRTN